MDKETLSNYGWIVICTLILAVMLALATPFGGFIAGAFKATYAGFGNVTDNALAVIGIGNGGNGGSGEQGDSGNEGQTPTNGKLGAPSYVGYSTEDDIAYTLFIMGADANTEGYYVYIYDELVATIGANETYTFPGTASSEAVPIKVIAFAKGYEDADAITGVCMYGAAGVGCEMYHYVPNVSLNGTILTIASTNEGAWGIMGDCFDIYVDGTKVEQRQSAEPEGKDFDLSAYLTGDAHEIVVETSYCEAGCKLRAYYTGDWPSVTIGYVAPAQTLNLIPVGGTYQSGRDTWVGDGVSVEFPETMKYQDYYYYGDYVYGYSDDGWSVYLMDNTKTSYGEILESINGVNVTDISNLFMGCSLAEAPVIPSTVKYMKNAFYNCLIDSRTIVVNANPVEYDKWLCAGAVDNIAGSSAMIDELTAEMMTTN